MAMERIQKTEAEWRAALSPEAFRVTRQKGTEPAFTGRYLNDKTAGVYHCVCCDQALFSSAAKFDSGTGWPSFRDPIEPEHVAEDSDQSLGMVRTEITCSRCAAHLGHRFEDGPAPTGQRYCINSAALILKARGGFEGEPSPG